MLPILGFDVLVKGFVIKKSIGLVEFGVKFNCNCSKVNANLSVWRLIYV